MIQRNIFTYVLLAALLMPGFSRAEETSHFRVLLVHSFGRDFPPFGASTREFRSVITNTSTRPVELLEASLELARFDGTANEQPLIDYLAAVFDEQKPDLVAASGAPAMFFCLRNREKLFPNAPLLAIGVEKRRLPDQAEGSPVVSSHSRIDLPAILQSMRTVLPDTRHIHVVGGKAPIDQFWLEQIRREWPPLAPDVEFHWLDALPMSQLADQIANLPPHSAIYLSIVSRDVAGAPYPDHDALEYLRPHASAPMFGFSKEQLGRGIVGGPLVDMGEIGRRAGMAAAEILAGNPPPATISEPVPLAAPAFDWNELQLWNIPRSRLPSGSTIHFRPPTLWESHRTSVLVALVILIIQFLLIALLAARKRARESKLQLERNRNEMARLSRVSTLGELSCALAHELNQPLGSILSNAQAARRLIARDNPPMEKIRDILDDVVSEDLRAAEVIKRLRALLERGESHLARIDMDECLDSVLVLAAADLRLRGITVVRTKAAVRPMVMADHVQLQQVILNLIGNARDAMDGQPAAQRKLWLTTAVDDASVRFSIRDSGPGFTGAPDALFEPFHSTKPGGLGMGLAICRSIIEAHKGRLWAEPGEPSGAVFHISIPAITPP